MIPFKYSSKLIAHMPATQLANALELTSSEVGPITVSMYQLNSILCMWFACFLGSELLDDHGNICMIAKCC